MGSSNSLHMNKPNIITGKSCCIHMKLTLYYFQYAHVEKNFLIDDTDAVSSGVSTLAISNDDGEKSNLNLTAAPVQIALKVPDGTINKFITFWGHKIYCVNI